MALILNQQNESIFLRQRIQDLEQRMRDLEQRMQERDREFQPERLRKDSDMALQQFQERGRQTQERERPNQERKLRDEKRQRRDQKRERHVEKRKKMLQQAKERERALQQERDRALRQAQEIARALLDVHEREQQIQEKRREVQEIATALQEAEKRERVLQQERDKLQQERDRALQEAQDRKLQALERARELREERARASQLAQLVQEKDLALQASTLDEYVKEYHGSLFSKLTIDPEAQHGRDATTANIRGKWQPRKVMEWTGFLSQQRLNFSRICDVFPPALRAFPRLITLEEKGKKIAPITDEQALARFLGDSIEEPVKNIMRELQSVDKLSRICQGEVRVDFINHAEHTKPLETETTSSQPGEPVPTRFCICRGPSVAMASSTLLYVWEHRAPHDLTIQHLRSALRPTTTFGEVTEETQSLAAAQDGEEVSQPSVIVEKRAKRAVTQTYHNMMESCLEFGILTTGQAIVFLHVNWDDPQTLYYHIAEPALDVAKAPERDAAFLSAVGQYVAFTIMTLTKSRKPKPLQERRIQVFKTLSTWGMPSRLVSSEHRNAASSPKIVHNGNGKQQSSPNQPYPYCSQKCLLGLVQGETLDFECPNVKHHCRSDADEAGAGHPDRHPVDHIEWLRLLQDQFKQSLDEGIRYESVFGARGALFKVTLLAYGYTFVSKGTVSGHIKHLEHEARVYEKLKPMQGQYVPVFLGTIDLRTVDKDYWIYFQTKVVHMMFLSWGGFLLEQDKMEELGVLHEIDWIDEGTDTLRAVHNKGVLHCDVRWDNILYSPDTKTIMLIDFERAELFHEPKPAEEDSHKEGSMATTTGRSKICRSVVDRACDENDGLVSIMIDALGFEG
ncbi:hypothetical protein E4U38_007071 [Claviceps purpurea]|nr:hypothetical protein E4U38_007071 [Claviceps purpurea]